MPMLRLSSQDALRLGKAIANAEQGSPGIRPNTQRVRKEQVKFGYLDGALGDTPGSTATLSVWNEDSDTGDNITIQWPDHTGKTFVSLNAGDYVIVRWMHSYWTPVGGVCV